ncbi:enhancer of mRNA-decapping protein [Achlya hypogyna]|uniref:Enhancer of mRNA-decapping protein n=1 Tax=Achlya hypogyna TaxID=1202772 RepID=A0A1V9YZ68_ACHHY|nr:enhancer of mRNA-decapping protein [Achlya hypogyna]
MEPRRSNSPAASAPPPGPNMPPPMPNYPHLSPYPPHHMHPGSMPMPPHMPPPPQHMPPPPPQQLMQPPSHMLSQLFPNLNMQGRSPSPASMPAPPQSSTNPSPNHRARFDPELTTPGHHNHPTPSALPIPALMRPSSASGAPVATRLPPPTAAVRSASISSPGVVSPGTRLIGTQCVYEPKADADARSLEVTPITLYVSERASDLGTLISVNEHYISYPIRNGLIRVINQSSVNRILLRKHEQHAVTELAFFNDHTDLLLSAGTDNHIVIWRLSEDMYAQKPMTREVLKTLPVRAQRVKWHPLDSNKIAIVQDTTVFVTELTDVHADADPHAFDLAAHSVLCDQSTSQVNDVAFAADGSALVSAGMDGGVHVYRLAGLAAGASATYVRRFDPFEGSPVNSLHVFSGLFGGAESGLLVGGQGNTQLSVWHAPWDTDADVCTQTFRLHNASTMHELVLDPTQQYVYVADRAAASLCVLHLASSPHSRAPRRLDNVTEFSLAYPILSMTVLHPAAPTASADDAPMQLYCIQTQAIQRYHVAPAACYLPPRSPMRREEPPAKEEPASPETELDLQITVHDFNGSEAGLSSMLATDGGNESVGRSSDDDEDDDDASEVDSLAQAPPSQRGAPASPRSVSSLPMPPPTDAHLRYARSSPSSSVHAFTDDVSSPRPLPARFDDDGDVGRFLRRFEALQRERDEQLKDQVRIMQQQLSLHMDKVVRKHLQAVLVPAIGRIVLHTMETNFVKPVTAHLEAQCAAVDAKFAGVVDDVKAPVREAFRDSFQSTIIPSFQAATQKMFEQINATFVEGTRVKIAETNEQWTGLQSQLAGMQAAVEGLTARLDALQGPAALAPAAAPDSQFEAQCREIDGLLAAKSYEVAFQTALGAENVALVFYTCGHAEPAAVLGSRPPVLSQMIVLCLVQQLGSDLQRDLALSLKWVQDALLVMNPRDAAIAPFVQNVLQELKGALSHVPEAGRNSQFTLVHHILNSMLSYT